jgi:hypothetical protein
VVRKDVVRDRCAIGLVANLALLPLARTQEAKAASAAVARTTDDACSGPLPGWTSEQQTWADKQCQVHRTIFGQDALDPGWCYLFTDSISSAGYFAGSDIHGREVGFTTIYAHSVPLADAESGT